MRRALIALQVTTTILALAGFAVLVISIRQPAASAPSDPATRIEADQKTGIIRFIVDGKEQARLDAFGLHVRQDINYGGSITDRRASYYDQAVAATTAAPPSKGKP